MCRDTIFDYYRQHGLKIKVAEYLTLWTKNASNDGRVVSNFILQALKNEDITIYGDGEQTQSFCYVDDLIYGLQAFMNSKDKLKGPLNLGNPYEVTIKKLAKSIIRLVSSSAKIYIRTFLMMIQSDENQTLLWLKNSWNQR